MDIPKPTGVLEGFNPFFVYDVKKNRRQVIYMVSDGDFIKIGKTKSGVESRIKSIQTGNPRPLKVMAIIHDDWKGETEKLLHKHFEYCRAAGEWFSHQNVIFDILANIEVRGGYSYLGHRIGLCKEWQEEVKRLKLKSKGKAKGIGYNMKIKKQYPIPKDVSDKVWNMIEEANKWT